MTKPLTLSLTTLEITTEKLFRGSTENQMETIMKSVTVIVNVN